MNKESIETLARRLAASLPQGLLAVKSDVEENFRAVLKGSLARMDLVTREEFEVQEAVLQRTREKLEALEARLTAHESGQQAAPAKEAKPAQKTAAKTARKTAKKKTT
ncbi:MAG: accessory factor UbiK family protein [Woeseia sp.]